MSARKYNTITAIHRTCSYNGPANGLGCYIQSCEERLMDTEKYRTFIDNMLTPLLKSNVQAIIINIDPLYKDSNSTRLTELSNGFFKVDKRISVIVPEKHVNAAVGRNITFNVIRQIDYDKYHTYPNILKHLLWYGMDDDDRVITDGPRDTLSYLLEHPKDNDTRILLQRENFNGDLYMVRYTIYNQNRTLYGVSFQNGKDPSNIVLDVRNKRLKKQLQISKTVADNIKTVFGTVILFMLHDKREFVDDSLIERWNGIVLSERWNGKYIPLKTFGGHKFMYTILWAMLIAIALIVLVIIVVIVCVKNTKTRTLIEPNNRC